MHFILTYELESSYLDRRGEFRDEHLAMAWAAHDRGELMIAGALQEPLDTALLVFTGESGAAAEAFAKNDPYVLNGLIKRWTVRPWTTVVGAQAATPVRPTTGAGR
jgi:uncharacterized protein YciI